MEVGTRSAEQYGKTRKKAANASNFPCICMGSLLHVECTPRVAEVKNYPYEIVLPSLVFALNESRGPVHAAGLR